MKSFRFYDDLPEDQRIKGFSPKEKMGIVSLLCLEAEGSLEHNYPDVDEDIACALEMSPNEYQGFKSEILKRGLFEIRDGVLTSILWADRSPNDNRPVPAEWRKLRAQVFERDGYICNYCGVKGVSLQCDHIIPVSRGGSNELSNLTTACRECNQSKHNKTPDEWLGGES